MFIMDYVDGQGWINPRIVPYGPIILEPSAMVFHYGQAIFEGLKAYRTPDGRINLFRPRLNFERVNQSNAPHGHPADRSGFLRLLPQGAAPARAGLDPVRRRAPRSTSARSSSPPTRTWASALRTPTSS